MSEGCGAPSGGVSVQGVDIDHQAVIDGKVITNGSAVTTGYARLLNADGDFVAEVPLGGDGGFRFFAAPGTWTVRVLAPGGISADRSVSADYGRVAQLEIVV